MSKQSSKSYQEPQVIGDFTVCEPVETGCCLRSCGGSPHHIGREEHVSEQTKTRFEDAANNRKKSQ